MEKEVDRGRRRRFRGRSSIEGKIVMVMVDGEGDNEDNEDISGNSRKVFVDRSCDDRVLLLL